MCDSYVLSESSLFVQRTKLVLKTCGTTKLLAALPTIVDLVHGLGMELVHLRFSRASFLFPQCQVCHCPLAPQFQPQTCFCQTVILAWLWSLTLVCLATLASLSFRHVQRSATCACVHMTDLHLRALTRPLVQPSPHHCFNAEADFLHAALQDLGLEGSHSVLGDVGSGLQWHLFVASLPQLPDTGLTGTTLEVCMTKLCPVKVRVPVGQLRLV